MSSLEVADIFSDFGPTWRKTNAGHLSLEQLKVMTAVERCRSAALGGHVLRCTGCKEQQISYNSCRNRHCPKCQASAAHRWLEARSAQLLPVEYFHVVFTLPSQIADIAYQNKALMYNLLFKAASKTLATIGKDPKHLGARLGLTAVLHTWGSAMTHHPHLHCIVPGGGLSEDKQRWVSCRKGFFLPVRVLSRLFRRLYLELLLDAHREGQLKFFGKHEPLKDTQAFERYLVPTRKVEWVVYAKAPFSGPEAVLRYLSRYTHRIAISNSRLVRANTKSVTFKWKDYRIKSDKRFKTMELKTEEFMRRFLIHVLPSGFHRIRHYGLLSNKACAEALTLIREHLNAEPPSKGEKETDETTPPVFVCRHCGDPMIVIETMERAFTARAPPVQGVMR